MGQFKLSVLAPCEQPWGSMAGDDRSRHCTRCQLRVHNLSGMSKDAAFKLLAGPEEHLCIRFNVRGDGTAVIGRESWLRRSLRMAGLVVASIAFWAAVVLVQLPWLALARKLSAPRPSAQPNADEIRAREARVRESREREAKARAELERRLAVIKGGVNDSVRMGGIGGSSRAERERIRKEYNRRRLAKQQH